jgi:hypothetical protein
MTVSDTPPPLTDEELFAQAHAFANGEVPASPEAVQMGREIASGLLFQVGRLRAEMAEARRVADCNNVAFQKSVDELTAVNTALRADSMPRAEVAQAMDALTRAAGEAITERDAARMERDALAAKLETARQAVDNAMLEAAGVAHGRVVTAIGTALAVLGETGGTDAR